MREVCWFSCGATSAIATKLACRSKDEVKIVYTQIEEEHVDNLRFLRECESWFGREITILRNDKYHASIYEVFERERYLVGPMGAPCTKYLKRKLRERFQQPGDVHILGFSIEEQGRADEFVDRNPDLSCRFPLIEYSLAKSDCLAMVRDAGIELPAMYALGYEHNNCVGCVKGGAGYWNKIRRDFPDVFERMAQTERKIGASILRVKGQSVYLDALDPVAGRDQRQPAIECGVFCQMAKDDIG